MCVAKVIFTVSYLLVLVGSIGMIIFARKFSFASSLWEQRYTKERLFGLNGYQVWTSSWVAILLGTVGQAIATWCQP